MKSIRSAGAAVLILALGASAGAEPRWSAARASEWYHAQRWPVGCNFIPSTPPIWFHDLFRPDGTPFRPSEVEFIRTITRDSAPR